MDAYDFPENQEEVSEMAFKIHRELGVGHTHPYSELLIFPQGCNCYDKARAELRRLKGIAFAEYKIKTAKYTAPDLFEPRET